MHGFWDVLWSDVTAFAMFAGPMISLSAPAAAVGAALGAIGQRLESRWRLVRAMVRGAVVGSLAMVVFGMLQEYVLRLEGLPVPRRELRELTARPLWGAAIVVALGVGFFAARRYTTGLLGSAPARRKFTLLHLFAAQLAVGLALGWWVFTRRAEIGYRHGEMSWEAQIAADKALFEPYGWEVLTWEEYDYFRARPGEDWITVCPPRPFRQQPVTDETLKVVLDDDRLLQLVVVSDGVTDAGLTILATRKNLNSLWIKSDQVTDNGIAELTRFPGLKTVGFESKTLTDVALQQLAGIKSLGFVSINSPQITPQAEAEFRAIRPEVTLKINSWPW